MIRAEAFGVGQPDALIRSGVYKWMPPLPANPGNDVAGYIEAVGRDVTALQVGQKVLLSARDLPSAAAAMPSMSVLPPMPFICWRTRSPARRPSASPTIRWPGPPA